MKNIKPVIWCVIYCCVLSCLLRLANSQHTLDFLHHQGYMISFSIIFTLTAYLWRFQIKHILLFTFSVLLYQAANDIKIFNDMILNERSIMQTLQVSSITFGCFSVLFYLSRFIKKAVLRKAVAVLSGVFIFLAFVPPAITLGYAAVSGGKYFSSDIALTLFQTNFSEIIAYLHEQNTLLWALSSIVLIALIGSIYTLCLSLKTKDNLYLKTAVVTGLFLSYLLVHDLPRMTLNATVQTTHNVITTLRSFENFNTLRETRLARLNDLKSTLTNTQNGIFMVVIGESTARNHMHAYGYKRENTPWLDTIKQTANAVVFEKAYSNHVHTIPAVTYALTDQNQYRAGDLENAYSLIDVATAAGFETWWISNQKKFSVSNTPVVTIAGSATHELFLNDYVGDKTMSTYFDEKLAQSIPDLKDKNKAFIVVHLMGCHAVYADRYQNDFIKFDEGNVRVDSYDNCILYNDYVLSQLYNSVKDNPEFKAWFYISDHGEDPDNGLTHESSKFTYAMSRIPFVSVFSDKFIAENPAIYQTLQKHTDAYWSSDLLYDVVLDVMGIRDMPKFEEKLSIASPEYNFTKDDILTVHGQKAVKNDDEIF